MTSLRTTNHIIGSKKSTDFFVTSSIKNTMESGPYDVQLFVDYLTSFRSETEHTYI